MEVPPQKRDLPSWFGNLLVALGGALFVASLVNSQGRPLVFAESFLKYLAVCAAVIGAIVATFAMGGSAVDGLVQERQKPRPPGKPRRPKAARGGKNKGDSK